MKNIALLLFTVLSSSCMNTPNKQEVEVLVPAPKKQINLSQKFKDYWYNGTAEVTSYDITQSRYGELREGKSTMIFVTEPFDPKTQVKSDFKNDNDLPVLKLNRNTDFITGIYPYSIMSSTFLPLSHQSTALKISGSIQEWCGQTYTQLNLNGDEYKVMSHSYFQSEGDEEFTIKTRLTENEIPLQLRLDPSKMPTGKIEVIPSVTFVKLKHIELKPYQASATLTSLKDGFLYSVKFEELNRVIAFKTEAVFPYKIVAWMDRYMDGGVPMVSTGNIDKTILIDYWNRNKNKDKVLRDSLGL
jgi:hypothetical protein